MIINNKKELFDFLNTYDYPHKNHLDFYYFLVKYSKIINGKIFDIERPILFIKDEISNEANGTWSEISCSLLTHYIMDYNWEEQILTWYFSDMKDNLPSQGEINEILEHEKKFQINNRHYEIIKNYPENSFLPNKIEIVKGLTEEECLDYLLNKII